MEYKYQAVVYMLITLVLVAMSTVLAEEIDFSDEKVVNEYIYGREWLCNVKEQNYSGAVKYHFEKIDGRKMCLVIQVGVGLRLSSKGN